MCIYIFLHITIYVHGYQYIHYTRRKSASTSHSHVLNIVPVPMVSLLDGFPHRRSTQRGTKNGSMATGNPHSCHSWMIYEGKSRSPPGWHVWDPWGAIGPSCGHLVREGKKHMRLVQRWMPKIELYHGKPHLIGGDWNMTCIFPYYWEFHHANWLIFFRGVQTTNQSLQIWWNHDFFMVNHHL